MSNIEGLKVWELIEYLKEFPKDTKVMFAYPSGDYWNTELAKPINSVEYGMVEHSDYHRTYKLTDEVFDIPESTDLEEEGIVIILQ